MRSVLSLVVLASVFVSGCGDDGDNGGSSAAGGVPRIVVTTSILGDVVGAVVGDAAPVEVIMPQGADPHEFQVSARQAEQMGEADLLVVNGADFEEGMEETIDAAAQAGAEIFAFADHVELLPGGEHGDDPHVWTDPTRMATAVEALGDALSDLEGVGERAAAYVDELEALDAAIESRLADVPPERRVLVTNHEVFAYFADRYDFEVVGAVIPSTTTGAEPSAADVEELAQVIESHQVPAVFADTTNSADVAEALADTVDDVEVVTLFTESLGQDGTGAETYLDMMRTNADLIHDALT